MTADKVTLKKNFQLVLRSRQTVTSKQGKAGDPLEFEVIRAVMAGDLVLVPRGAIATGHVTNAARAGMMQKGGALQIDIESVTLVTGQSLPLHGIIDFEGGASTGPGSNGMMGFGGYLASTLQKGSETGIPKGARLPAWVREDLSVDLAEVKKHQPAPAAPNTSFGSLYLFMDAVAGRSLEAKFLVGEQHYFLPSEMSLVIELPPGDYWVRTGRTAKNDRFGKLRQADCLHLAVKAGESYYITAEPDAKDRRNAILRTYNAAEGDAHIEQSEVFYEFRSATLDPDMRQRLQVQPAP